MYKGAQYMQLLRLEISNFRGIKSSNILFSIETRLLCMIGAGDGTKTTLLKAIEWLFWPTWNLNIADTDFYNCDTSTSIILRGTFTEIPTTLLSEEKYGLYLRRQEVQIGEGIDDEPLDNQPLCLTIQLTIDSSLEPKWEIICNRKEPRSISYRDRELLVVGCVGSNCERDMVWNRFSVLQKYANSKGILHEAFIMAMREVADHADLHKLDDISTTIKTVGSQYGVDLAKEVKSKLLIQDSRFTSSVGLFEGNAPLCQKGLGSQRLLSMGLNINATEDGALLLIDEVETGLEPYRIRSLINEFRAQHSNSGQIIMTTHSPTVVSECTTNELLIIQSSAGKTTAYPLFKPDLGVDGVIQGQVRRNPDAFLCKRIIVCEGKTEIGFIRAMDNFIATEYHYRMAYEGIGIANGGGEQLFDCAILLAKCGYDVCIFMDSDDSKKEDKKEEVKRKYNIGIYDWDNGKSIEEQLFSDISKHLSEQLLQIAVEEKGYESIAAKLNGISHVYDGKSIKLGDITPEQQFEIGSIAKAKKSSWYKRVDIGERLGNVVFSNWSDINKRTTLSKTINGLIDWVTRNDTKRN